MEDQPPATIIKQATATTTSTTTETSLLFFQSGGLLEVDYWSILHLLITILLCLVSMFVVLGNSLVVGAIWHENQLHSVTNYLIASLAVADCLVGLVVMPFSIISEIILGSWSFGATWCDLWHSLDVLASTASIMNLCAISLDRYLAITDPISYPARMTPKRVAILIVSLWTCSALISFPAIIWWRSVGQGPLAKIETPSSALAAHQSSTTINQQNRQRVTPTLLSFNTGQARSHFGAENSSAFRGLLSQSSPLGSSYQEEAQLERFAPEGLSLLSERFHPPANNSEELYKCVFTDDTYYLLFSSFISFYGPLCVMLYAYYRIYKAAVRQMRFLKHGSKQVMVGDRVANGSHASVGGASGDTGRNGLVLRVHRGGGGSNSLNLKSVLNKRTTTAVPSSPVELSPVPESNQEAAQVLYYESGKLFHKLTRLKDFSSTSVDANSLASTNTTTTKAACLGVHDYELPSDVIHTQAEAEADADEDFEPDNSSEPNQTATPAAEAQHNKSSCQPEGPVRGFGSVLLVGKPASLSSKLSSNQHVVQISNHQSSRASAGSDANIGEPEAQTPARSHSTIADSSSMGTITPTATPQHKIQQQQQQQNRKVGRKLSRLAKERKAAKTLGIVVGVFILCWLPYFVLNITVGLCGSRCISHLDIIMPIVTWLGWLNSAMNPVIYACWSREFRRAFRRVLCSWVIFFCPYGDSSQQLIKKLKLKDNSNYSSNTNATSSQQDAHSLGTVTRPSTLSNSLRTNPSNITRTSILSGPTGSDSTPAGTVAPSYTTINHNNCIVTISSPLKDDELGGV